MNNKIGSTEVCTFNNYKMYMEGHKLNLEKDFPLFLFLISKGEREFSFKFRECFDWIGKKTQMRASSKKIFKDSLHRFVGCGIVSRGN